MQEQPTTTETNEKKQPSTNPPQTGMIDGMNVELPDWIKNLIPAAGGVGVTYLFMIKPLQDKVEELDKKVQQLTNKIEELEKKHKKDKNKLKERIEKIEYEQEEKEMEQLNGLDLQTGKTDKKVRLLK